mmetsp:Transcript_89864/g.284469  ORF Transcript_89864/g.284469 Transcript_89864/m.284469 type:complete len:204 (+) Transcript_89864:254-865(+)
MVIGNQACGDKVCLLGAVSVHDCCLWTHLPVLPVVPHYIEALHSIPPHLHHCASLLGPCLLLPPRRRLVLHADTGLIHHVPRGHGPAAAAVADAQNARRGGADVPLRGLDRRCAVYSDAVLAEDVLLRRALPAAALRRYLSYAALCGLHVPVVQEAAIWWSAYLQPERVRRQGEVAAPPTPLLQPGTGACGPCTVMLDGSSYD